MLANPPDSAKITQQQAPSKAPKNITTDAGACESSDINNNSTGGDNEHHPHSHTAASAAGESKDSLFTGYNPFAISAPSQTVNSHWTISYDTQVPPPLHGQSNSAAANGSHSHLPPLPSYAEHHRGHQPPIASASSQQQQQQHQQLPIGYGIGRSRFPPPPPPPPPYDGGSFMSFGDLDCGPAGVGGGSGSWTSTGASGLLGNTAGQAPHYTTATHFQAPPPPPSQMAHHQQPLLSLLGAPNGSGGSVGGGPNAPPLSSNVLAIPLRHRELLEQLSHVDLDALPSYDPRGYDIGTNDVSTLRFFYNLGHEFYRQLSSQFTGQALAQLTRSPAAAADEIAQVGGRHTVEPLRGILYRVTVS